MPMFCQVPYIPMFVYLFIYFLHAKETLTLNVLRMCFPLL